MVDVFAMPQSGTGVSVEAVDYVYVCGYSAQIARASALLMPSYFSQQTKMMDMLKQTGRPEIVVGWYHSHPGFGCWLSHVDVNTQQVRLVNSSQASKQRGLTHVLFCLLTQSFEKLDPRCVAVVIDPIQSVKGKVVIDAFRSIPPVTISRLASLTLSTYPSR